MIVGSVELAVAAAPAGFYESLVKTTDPAADKAGGSAGKLFASSFTKGIGGIRGSIIESSKTWITAAADAGEIAGLEFARAYSTAMQAGMAAVQVPAARLVAESEAGGAEAGQAFAAGMGEQMSLFGEEGLAGGRAFSRSFIEGTASLTGQMVGEGATAGRAFVGGFTETTAAGLETRSLAGGAASTLAWTEQGQIAGRAFVVGQREAMAVGSEESAATTGLFGRVTQWTQAGFASGLAFVRGQREALVGGEAATTSSAAFGRLGAGAEAAGATAGARYAGALSKGVAIGALALVAGTAYMAGQFQQKTNILVTAAGEDVRALGMVRQGILDIATSTGTKWQDLTDGMYQIEKAGYRGADGLKILRAAAQAAREEGANLATVTNATTSVMASYHLGVDQAVGVTNAIKTAAGESKTTMEQFAGALSTVLPIASANHIAFADVAGAMATLTQHGTSADEATQELSNTIRNLAAPNQVASKEMAQLGINSNQVSQLLGTRGLTGTLDFLSQTVLQKMGPAGLLLLDTFNKSKIAAQAAQTEYGAMGPAAQKLAQGFESGALSVADYRKAARALPGEQGVLAMQFFQTYSNAMGFQNALKQGGPAAQTYSAAIKAMTGGANGLNTTLQLTGESLDGTRERTKRIADAMAAGGKDVQGWSSTQKLFNVQMDEAKQKLAAAAITLGTGFLPVISKIVGPLGDAVKGLIDFASSPFGKIAVGVGLIDVALMVLSRNPVVAAITAITLGFGWLYDHHPMWAMIAGGVLAVTAAFWALDSVPIVFVISSIAMGLIELIIHFRQVSDFLHGPWMTAISAAVAVFFPFVGIPALIIGHWRGLLDFFKGVGRALTDPIGSVKRAWDDLLGGFQNPGATFSKAIDGFDHFFLSLGEHIRRLPGDLFDFGKIIGNAIGRFTADAPRWVTNLVGSLLDTLGHVDWGHVAAVVGDGLINGVKAIWRNKTKIAEVGAAIVGGILLAMFGIPLALAGIGLLLAGGIVVGIAKGLAGAAGAVGRFFERMWHDAAGFASRMASDVAGFFSRMWHDVTGFAGRIWADVTGFFARLGRDITKAVGDAVDFIGRHWRLLIVIFTGPIGFVVDLVYKFRQQIGGFFERMWHDVSDFASRIWRDVTGWFTRTWRDVSITVAVMWAGVTAFASRIWRDVTGFFTRMWRDVTGWTSRMWHDVTGWFARMWADTTGFTSRIWRDVTGWFSRMWKDVTGWTSRMWHDVAGFFTRMWADVTGVTSRIWHDVTGWFSKTRDDSTRTANDLWHKVLAPFQSLWGDLSRGFNVVVGAIDRAWNKLKDILKGPVNFFIDPVYNKGVLPVWNFVMDVVGEPSGKLHPVNKLDAGGGLSGPARGDDRLAMVGGGEHMWTADEVAAAGGHERVAAMRAAVLGRPVRVMGDGSGRYLFGGGVLHDLTHNPLTDAAGSALHAVTHNPVTDAIGGVVKGLAGMVRGAAADVAAPALNGAVSLLEHLIGSSAGKWGHEVGQVGHHAADKMVAWIRGADAKDQAAMAATLGGPAYGGSGDQWVHGVGLKGVNLEFFNRVHRMAQAMHTPITVNSGFRSLASQQVLYAKYLNGTGNLAAKPGSSNHEKGLAMDIAPGRPVFGGRAGGFGLKFPIPSEAWHIEPTGGGLGGATYSGGGPAGETIPGSPQAIARALLGRFGWGLDQYPPLNSLWTRESGWRVNAQNGSSGAYGIPQALPASKMASAGADWRTNPATQEKWGLGYIHDVYGSPAAAWAHSQRVGWYDQGGILGHNQIGINTSGRDERVLDPNQTEAFERLVVSLEKGGGRRGDVHLTTHIHGVDIQTAHTMTGRQLQLAVQGAGLD